MERGGLVGRREGIHDAAFTMTMITMMMGSGKEWRQRGYEVLSPSGPCIEVFLKFFCIETILSSVFEINPKRRNSSVVLLLLCSLFLPLSSASISCWYYLRRVFCYGNKGASNKLISHGMLTQLTISW